MKKWSYIEIVCWLIGAAIWAIIAWSYFSDGKVYWGLVQSFLSVAFMLKGIFRYYNF